jgi:hypothetical protein
MLFLLLLGTVAAQSITDFLWQFGTDGFISSNPNTDKSGQDAYHFVVSLCGGELYNNRTALISVNLFSHAWSNDNLHCFAVSVSGKNGLITTNRNAQGGVDPDVAFVYSKSDGDLQIAVKNCGGINDWTLGVSFSTTNTGKLVVPPQRNVSPPKGLPGFATHGGLGALPIEPGLTYELVPFSTDSAVYTVESRDIRRFRLQHCSNFMSYQLTVTVNAVDTHSAMSTFVCADVSPCTPAKAKGADNSAKALNTVTLQTSVGDLKNIEIAVEGYGRYGENNSFRVSVGIKRI